MILPPIIPITFLILGALAVGASDLARLRRPSLVMVIASGFALGAVLLMRSDTPDAQIIASWQPVSVFTVPISFRVDQTAWIIALGLTLILIATAFTWLAYPGQRRPAPRALSLLLIATAIASVFASNLLTLAVAWGLFDLVFVAALLVRSGPHVGRRAAVAIVLSTSATLCVWVATLLIENSHDSLYWHLLDIADGPRLWLAAAAVLRVGLYPLHQWLPIELGHEPDRAVLLFTAPTAVGLALWSRLAIANALPAQSITPILAALSALIGGALAWRSSTPQRGLPFIALGLSGLAVVNVGASTTPGTLTTATLNWMFVMVSLFITRGLDRRAPWWSIGALIAGLSLIGLPGTLGFSVRQSMIGGLTASRQWWLLITCALGELLIVTAAIRLLLSPATEEEPIAPLRQISFALALACAALPMLVLALIPSLIPAMPSLQQQLNQLSALGVVLWLLPIVGGVLLAQRDHRQPATEPASAQPLWTYVLRLDWFNAVASFFVRRMTELLRAIALMIEGEGGLIWALIVVIIGLVLTSGVLK